MKKNGKIYIIIGAGILLLTGVAIGRYFFPSSTNNATTRSESIRINSSDYKYTNPLLVSGTNTEKAPEYKSFTDKLSQYINKEIGQKNADDVSVYFRDLNSGIWSGVNENDIYSPASMLKVAVLIAVLRIAENNKDFLNKKITMTSDSIDLNSMQTYAPKNPVLPGKSYTVQYLINAMIIESDNNAKALLEHAIGEDKVRDLMHELQLPELPKEDVDFLSPKMYSRLYRILYNSTYLSASVSEQTLKFLTKTHFTEGLRPGVPEQIEIAHKFGERESTKAGVLVDRQLHDCGIVYAPGKPYFICVMTKGKDFEKLQAIISEVSRMVWNNFGGAAAQ